MLLYSMTKSTYHWADSINGTRGNFVHEIFPNNSSSILFSSDNWKGLCHSFLTLCYQVTSIYTLSFPQIACLLSPPKYTSGQSVLG
jgi:hypothetical protein